MLKHLSKKDYLLKRAEIKMDEQKSATDTDRKQADGVN